MKDKRVFFNVVSSILLQILVMICGFIVPKVIMQSYGSSVNGLVTSITKFLAYILLLELGMGPVVKSVLYKPIANKDREEIRKILKAADKFFKRVSYIFIIYVLVLCFIIPSITSKDFSIEFTIPLANNP